jgi:hypothetical protein
MADAMNDLPFETADEMSTLSWSDLYLANCALWDAFLRSEARIAELREVVADLRSVVEELKS